MDTTDPEISFDDEGVCNHCRAYDERVSRELLPPEKAEQRLQALVAEIKAAGAGQDYECVIGVSGGVDSTMVAYHVKNLGLRPLAIHVDNGWNSELAVQNIERCLNSFDIDLKTHVIDWEEFRDLQRSLLRAGVPNIEAVTDHAIMAVLFREAVRNRIKYVISGGNIATESIMPQSWMYDARDWRHLAALHKRFGELRLRTFPHATLGFYAYCLGIKRIRYVPILNYLPYDKEKSKRFLEQEFGWRDYGGKHFESFFTRFFQCYILPTKFGMDKRRPHFSSLICSGQMTRDAALQAMQQPPYDEGLIEENIEYFVKKIGLSRQEFDTIMAEPPKSHSDYPSNRILFADTENFIPFVKRFVKPRSLR